MSIESRIREQKEKIKEAQRELSRLQDEARKKEEPRKLLASCGSRTPGNMPNENIYTVRVCAESGPLPNFEEIEKAIESLSPTPSEPKSYVDWDDDLIYGFNWLAKDEDGKIWAYRNKPSLGADRWMASGPMSSFHQIEGMSLPAPWDKSLIYRPGTKE